MANRYVDGPRPRLFGHRGASASMPENTLPSFSQALAEGAERLEMDVHLSADGEVIVFHDEDVDRTTDGKGPIGRLRLSEIKELDAGYQFEAADGSHPFRGRRIRIPTFGEVLTHFARSPLNIELKADEPALVAAVDRLLDRYDARSRVLLAAESQSIMKKIRAKMPDVLTSMCMNEVLEFLGNGGNPGYSAPCFAIQCPVEHAGIPIITKVFVDIAHACNMEVHAWVINDQVQMRHLVSIGVDGIMTDYPVLGASVLGRQPQF